MERRFYLAGLPATVGGSDPDAIRRAVEADRAQREAALRADQAKRDAEQAQTNARIKTLEQQLAANAAQPKVLAPPVAPIVPAPPPSVTSPDDPALAVVPGSGRSFRDCAECPEMVVAPAGSFTMGSPDNEEDRSSSEGPRRRVTISRPFAVGQFAVTFDEWEACVAGGGCPGNRNPSDKAGAKDVVP
jgi:formylglycine-generating enzyme required for sulfatase activity